jgi:hypothetical protein
MQVIEAGKTNVSLVLRLQDALNGSPKTGLTITDLQLRYIRLVTDNSVTISAWQSLTALGAGLTEVHTDNAGFEVGEGYYRIDIPDAVLAAGANTVKVLIQDSVGSSILVASREIDMSGVANTVKSVLPISWVGV